MLLKFYGYYKQATDGPCNRPKPSMFKVVEKAKWDAWNSVKNLTKDEAMIAYVNEIKNVGCLFEMFQNRRNIKV